MAKTEILWTDYTWNPVTGCTKISAGCKNCYAERMAKRLKGIGQANYQEGFNTVVCHGNMLKHPLKWKSPKKIFVNSMGDLFHKDVPLAFIQKVFAVMNQAHWHTFQVLTKRSERLMELSSQLNWTDNIWMGVSIEDANNIYRMEHLKKTGAKIKVLSIEPLIGPLGKINLDGIDWVIVGGESGPNSRPIDADWVRELRDQSVANKVPFFFKQWGGVNKKKTGRLLDGTIWGQYPVTQYIKIK